MCFIIFTQNHTRHLSFFKKVTFPVNTFGKIPVRPYIQHQQFILNSGMYPLTTFLKIQKNKTQHNKKTPNQKILILPISLMNIRHLSLLELGICLQYIRHCALNLKDTRPSVHSALVHPQSGTYPSVNTKMKRTRKLICTHRLSEPEVVDTHASGVQAILASSTLKCLQVRYQHRNLPTYCHQLNGNV